MHFTLTLTLKPPLSPTTWSSQKSRTHLESLLKRIKVGSYYAPPVRRQYIPKADGRKRPLGIPTLEDKVAQRTILMLLEPIYEAHFLPCSYGFRPGAVSP